MDWVTEACGLSGQSACEAAREVEEQTGRGELATLLRDWRTGETTALVKAITILRDSNARIAQRYRGLSIVPRPEQVQRQIDYYDHATAALDHAIACIKMCGRRGHKRD